MESILKQSTIPNVKVNTIKSPDSKELYIVINQDGKNIMVEHSKIVEFLKTINSFK